MHIAVIGAGAVGGTLAALLDRAGHTIQVTARGDNLAAIRAAGLRLDGGWGEHVARVEAHETLIRAGAPVPDFAILATKAQDAAAALHANLGALGTVPVLVAQNGLGGIEVARSVLPESALLGGLALFAASYLEPGRVTVTAPLPLIIGSAPGTDDTVLSTIADVMRGALPVEVTSDILGAQWTKLLINHVNALPAITGLSVQQVIADSGLRRVMTASMRETVRVARRLGIRFGAVQGINGRILGAIGSAPLALGAWFPIMLRSRMGSVPNPGSTLQSIKRGQLTEIDFLNGAVVSAAKAEGITAPINEQIVRLVHEVECTGSFLTPTEVAARVRV
ncbi:MAG: ketopantoate reductase family protein [Acidobacteria bacterium]|nr:ketopantoate reductase family protein [Acidobacteriota bacterium]